VKFLYSILVLFLFAPLIYIYFELKKDLSLFYNFKFCHTTPQHRGGLPTSCKSFAVLSSDQALSMHILCCT
jgi:hypothetical protein